MSKFFISIFLVLLQISSLGQGALKNKHTSELYQCGFDYIHQNVRPIDYPLSQARSEEVLTMPIVFHVIHKGEPVGEGTNISDEQIHSALVALNNDFRKIEGTFGDGDGVDTKIEFCLVSRDEDDNPSTGIYRVDGTVVPVYAEDGIGMGGQPGGASELAIKNLSRVSPTFAYNVWIVSEILGNNGGGGIQGYAYFPSNSLLDGTVVMHNVVGTVGNVKPNSNRSKTLSHELGHGFNLFHTFEGNSCIESNCELQGDRVCDTPPTILNSNCNNPACNGTQQVNNYMDYTSQLCRDMFTEGQKNRMRAAAFGIHRSPLLTSNACVPINDYDIGITSILNPIGDICSIDFNPIVTVFNFGSEEVTEFNITYGVVNGNISTFNWVGNLLSNQSITLTLPTYFPNIQSGEFFAQTNLLNDQNSSNDIFINEFSVISGVEVYITITTDFYGNETTWNIKDSLGSVIALGGPFPNGQIGQNHEYTLCLPEGCYEFNLYDSQGDGICCSFGAGGWLVEDSYQNILSSGGGGFPNGCQSPLNPDPSDQNCFEVWTDNFCLSLQITADCNGDLGGTAFIDSCGVCVGGNTQLEPCIQDCNGEWGGTAFIDNCGDCVYSINPLEIFCSDIINLECLSDYSTGSIDDISYTNNCLPIDYIISSDTIYNGCEIEIFRTYTIWDLNDTVQCTTQFNVIDQFQLVTGPELLNITCYEDLELNELDFNIISCTPVEITYIDQISNFCNDTILRVFSINNGCQTLEYIQNVYLLNENSPTILIEDYPENIYECYSKVSYEFEISSMGECGEVTIEVESLYLGDSDTTQITNINEIGLTLPTFIVGSRDYVVDNVKFIRNCDGTANIIGTFISAVYEQKGWELNLNLSHKFNYEDWLNFSGSFINDGIFDNTLWDFYNIESGTLVGILDFEGSLLNLTPAAIPQGIGVQVGEGANTINNTNGIYTRFYYSGNWDLNPNVIGYGELFLSFFELNQSCSCEFHLLINSVDECGNISEDQLLFLGSQPKSLITSLNNTNTPEILIFPNPSFGNFQIESSIKMETLFIFNINGELISRFSPNSNYFKFDLSSYKNGVYFIIVNEESRIKVIKI